MFFYYFPDEEMQEGFHYRTLQMFLPLQMDHMGKGQNAHLMCTFPQKLLLTFMVSLEPLGVFTRIQNEVVYCRFEQ